MGEMQPTGPGSFDGHAWLSLSRWGMAWRVMLASALIGMFGVLTRGLAFVVGLFALVVVVLLAAQAFAILRPAPDPVIEEPPGPECRSFSNGQYVEIPCY